MYIADFVAYLSSEKGLSQNTLYAYQKDVKLFLESGLSLLEFLSELKSQGYKPSSLSRILISLKVYYRFLKREGYCTVNEAATIPGPQLWQLIPDILSQEEVESLLAAPDRETFLGARDAACLELLYASGLRVSELCGLKITDVDDTFVKVHGKGNKERVVPIGKKALQAIDHWITRFRCLFDSEANVFLFLTAKGKPLYRIEVWRQVKFWARQASIQKNIFPHTFRHTFATHLLDHGADLRIIQEMLGHASISSTDRYTHISRQALCTSFHRFHPRP